MVWIAMMNKLIVIVIICCFVFYVLDGVITDLRDMEMIFFLVIIGDDDRLSNEYNVIIPYSGFLETEIFLLFEVIATAP